jgi:predicted amidophosphoribosyltransferase
MSDALRQPEKWPPKLRLKMPSRCYVCGMWPARPWGRSWCATCEIQWAKAVPRCHRCATRISAHDAVCGACLTKPPTLASCCTAVDYSYPWASIVLQLKGEFGMAWAQPMAHLMWAALQTHFGTQIPTLWAPVPLHPRKLRARGHNQAWALTQALAQCAVASGASAPQLVPDLLLRVREGLPQHALHHAERWANMRNSFALGPGATGPKAGAPAQRAATGVLLIDDVFTTGATLCAAAQHLGQAFDIPVHAAVFARTRRPKDG